MDPYRKPRSLHRAPAEYSSFDLALAEYTVGLLCSDDLPNVATHAMLAGVESPSLAALSGSRRGETPADLRDMFERGLSEAGIGTMDPRHAALVVIDGTARAVAAGGEVAAAVTRLKDMFDLLEEGADTNEDLDALGLASLRSAVWEDYFRDETTYVDTTQRLVREACTQLVTVA